MRITENLTMISPTILDRSNEKLRTLPRPLHHFNNGRGCIYLLHANSSLIFLKVGGGGGREGKKKF